MQALVTGGAGFIGSHIAQRLVQEGHSVRVLDNLRTGKLANLSALGDQLEFVEGDIRNMRTLKGALRDCDTVFHQAAVVSVPYSVEHPEESNEINIVGTLRVLMAARDCGVRRVVVASSAAVYGMDRTLPKQESMLPCPATPYGLEKLTAEYYCRIFSDLYGVEAVALRYFNVYGPRQDPSSPYSGVISIFADRLMADQPPTIFGDGQQTRDFVFVSDVVDANLLAASAAVPGGSIVNVGGGKETSLNCLVDTLREITGCGQPTTYAEPRAGDIRHSLADIRAAREVLGYAPKVELEEGLGTLLDWLRS